MALSRKAEALLKKLAQDHLIENPNAIINLDGQEIKAFGKFTIVKRKQFYDVYRWDTLIASVYSQRVAICVCVAEKYNQLKLAKELAMIEQKLIHRETDVEQYKYSISKTQDNVRKSVLQSRLHDASMQIRLLKEQLNKCINLAKYWQQKGFENETSRFGLKKPSTTK